MILFSPVSRAGILSPTNMEKPSWATSRRDPYTSCMARGPRRKVLALQDLHVCDWPSFSKVLVSPRLCKNHSRPSGRSQSPGLPSSLAKPAWQPFGLASLHSFWILVPPPRLQVPKARVLAPLGSWVCQQQAVNPHQQWRRRNHTIHHAWGEVEVATV